MISIKNWIKKSKRERKREGRPAAGANQFLLNFISIETLNCFGDSSFFYLFIFLLVLHTSASLALNESWDPDVR